MDEGKISVRYAKALFNLAVENNTLSQTKADIELMAGLAKNSPEFNALLFSPIISTVDKKRVLFNTFEGRLHKSTFTFLELLLKNGRESVLKDVCRNFLAHYRRHLGIRQAFVTTAVPIDKAMQTKIIEMIRKKFQTEVELTTNVDEKIIGGLVLQVDDRQIDSSVSNALNRFRREATSSAYQKKI